MSPRNLIPLLVTAFLPAASLLVLLQARAGAYLSKDMFPLVFAAVVTVAGLGGIVLSRRSPLLLWRAGLVLIAILLALGSFKSHLAFKQAHRLAREEKGKASLLAAAAPRLVFEEAFNLESPAARRAVEELSGPLILLDFWATWCTPCLQVMPELQALQEEHAAELLVVGVTRLYDAPAERNTELAGIEELADRLGVRYPILVSGDMTWRDYGISTLPTSVLLDGDGTVLDYGIGIDGAERVVKLARRKAAGP